ncbi:MAG: hypothetical protein ONB48_06380 [candidate division KSB1 bacterium]|nr:hypothetical protein [candidate division KSB1 bacterium]MDZ7273167.1 hypothetical protein [candidate division KSB1 bacterium]MDZ7285269.1 hypothetical protein [candidate division KSB1 bacterium]MDZ7298301.1 hypothetical protein [candidate division KSB1 bacterium]MDZ7349066.1 hypothetical protein [candidate division KSB1 bacterium]
MSSLSWRLAPRWLVIAGLGLGLEAGAQVATVNQPHGKINLPCSDCHTARAWSPLRLDLKFKHETTGFALAGQHATVDCKRCHSSLKFTGASRECTACHEDVHDGTLGRDCTRCHTFQGWREFSRMNAVHQASRFPLLGLHQRVACENCHTRQGTSQFINLPLQCGVCHRQDYEATTNPNHREAGFSMRCELCHSSMIIGWASAGLGHLSGFDHNRTRFPLQGAHSAVDCGRCHGSGRFAGTPTDCFACHQDDYQRATNPNHVAENFSQNCSVCHSNVGWQPANFDHNRTRFPLQGAHSAVDCGRCHGNGRFAGTPTACFSCHQADYQRATNPNHVAGNFSQECSSCHSNVAWKPANFDHNRTRFPLQGAHSAVDCGSCHGNGRFAGTPTACFSCHQDDYQRATNPNHVAGNFSQECSSCHSNVAWKPANFDHNRTRFPLTGAHLAVACAQCHVNGQYTGTPTACFSCHQADYQRATNPNHVAGNFSQECSSCHTTSAWQPSTFDHNRTRFPLQGAHLTTACAQCHVNNRYAGTPTDCYSCHQADFQRPTNPNHVTLNFSHDCTVCHTMNAWLPATFDHDSQYFRIYSGKHRGKWQSCATCHVNAANYKIFECIFCHEHNQTKMDEEHRNRSGYQYNSQACYRCHPRV